MQNSTGCKINVSPASGRDIEREIGLVGTRQAIELAKRAIMEKVDAVVRSQAQLLCQSVLLTRLRSSGIDLKVETDAMTTDTTHNTPCRSKTRAPRIRRMHRFKVSHRPLQAKIRTQPMVATITMSLCGTPPWLNNNSSNRAVQVKLTLQVAFDQHDLTVM